MFGQGFISPGGERLTQELAARLGLDPDAHVLDVGCGVGGSAFHLARTLGCYVYGIDLSANMILTALERAAASGNGDKASRRLGGMEGGVWEGWAGLRTLDNLPAAPPTLARPAQSAAA